MTAWTDLVKKIWNENKKTPGFKFKDALIKAKSQYKSTPLNKSIKKIKTKILGRKRGGTCPFAKGGEETSTTTSANETEQVAGEVTEESHAPVAEVTGGKSKRRTKKNKKEDTKEDVKKGGDKLIGSTDKGTPYFSEGK